MLLCQITPCGGCCHCECPKCLFVHCRCGFRVAQPLLGCGGARAGDGGAPGASMCAPPGQALPLEKAFHIVSGLGWGKLRCVDNYLILSSLVNF